MQNLETQQEVPRIVDDTMLEAIEQRGLVPRWARDVLGVDALERVSSRGQAQAFSRRRELDDERAPLDRCDTANAEFRIVAMGEVIPGLPDGGQCAVSLLVSPRVPLEPSSGAYFPRWDWPLRCRGQQIRGRNGPVTSTLPVDTVH